MIKHYNIRVSGLVQGVFFRVKTKEKADELGIKGFVKNEKNGDVYIEAEAEESSLVELLQWCHKGPAKAKVEKVDIAEADIKAYKSFEVKRY